MQSTSQQPGFLVYNASAGSGKTYSLVRAYLHRLLGYPGVDGYRQMLAITFTNKAVAEMKERIVGYLADFSSYAPGKEKHNMMHALEKSLGFSEEQMIQRSRAILHHLLHHYAGFSIETIDGFNHRLIRTFARDLQIASNFEVSLDLDELLGRAVDRLLQMAGDDKEITRVLVEFSMQKTDEDRSWDISRDILSASKILFSENDRNHVALLRRKTLQQFKVLEDEISKKHREALKDIEQLAGSVLGAMEANQITDKGFSGGYYPKFFRKLLAGDTNVSFGAQWQQKLLDEPLYSKAYKKKEPDLAARLDELQPQFTDWFIQAKRLVPLVWLLENLLSNLTPLSVINLVRREVEAICEEENVLPIAEFNQRIHDEIKGEPVPYIYERLGDRYHHFYIDEFQDTSVLQWGNLIPLIDNALSQGYEDGQSGSLLLVGDAKQSIYRWRGGVPEQFIDLYQCKNPFPGSIKKTENLETNWRSCRNIIEFNNAFFSYLSGLFGDPVHAELYQEGNEQKATEKDGGYVQLDFVESSSKEEDQEVYSDAVVEQVQSLLAEGYDKSSICLLTRKTDQGVLLGQALMEKEIPVVSSETLLLNHSPLVRFLENVIRYTTEVSQESTEVAMLVYLYRMLSPDCPLHTFLEQSKDHGKVSFEKGLEVLESGFDPKRLRGRSLYEACELILDALGLSQQADASVQGFLDMILKHGQSSTHGSFLDHWESQKEKAAVQTPTGLDAIKIMTIHKAKGLEFPVVIFPFADENLYYEQRAKTWYDLSGLSETFKESLVSVRKEFETYGPSAQQQYRERRNILELDSINLLYVTFTRAAERLYVLARRPSDEQVDTPTAFNSLLAGYLSHTGQWDPEKHVYTFGLRQTPLHDSKKTRAQVITPGHRISFPDHLSLEVAGKEARQWFDDRDGQIERGNELHDLMAQIGDPGQAHILIDAYRKKHDTPWHHRIAKMAQTIFSAPEMKPYFKDVLRWENERDLLSDQGDILRPDRIHYNADGSLTVIDYKTGGPDPAYKDQLLLYRTALEAMGHEVRDALLVYVSEEGVLINKL